MPNIAGAAVQARLEDALSVRPARPLDQPQFADIPAVTPEGVKEMLDAGTRVQVIDVRPRHYATRAQDMMSDAVWRDPERVSEWIGELSKEAPVVTFCVYGFHVGWQTGATLKKGGLRAQKK